MLASRTCPSPYISHMLAEPSSNTPALKQSNTRQAVRLSPPESVGEGNCSAPMLVPGTLDTYTTRCMSVGWPMKPGEVVNSFFSLPSPYPEDSLIAIVTQSVQVVDDTLRPVPLSEMYVHHVFGDARNVLGEVCLRSPFATWSQTSGSGWCFLHARSSISSCVAPKDQKMLIK
jgi:hypothetical protein